jgi:TPR repeat protein
LFERAAELGAGSALVNLGRIFSDRSSQLFDPQRARACFSSACDRGEEQGCVHLAQMLAGGEGGSADKAGARRILERVSRQSSDPKAQEMALQALRKPK